MLAYVQRNGTHGEARESVVGWRGCTLSWVNFGDCLLGTCIMNEYLIETYTVLISKGRYLSGSCG